VAAVFGRRLRYYLKAVLRWMLVLMVVMLLWMMVMLALIRVVGRVFD